jgi:HNH endonuclease
MPIFGREHCVCSCVHPFQISRVPVFIVAVVKCVGLSSQPTMTEQIDRIRQLLDELEATGAGEGGTLGNSGQLPAVEMSLVIQEIVDDLQPQLTPYEAAFYWYLFRHSLAANGKPFVRVGQDELRRKTVRQARNFESIISQSKARETLTALEKIGAIRREGEPSRDGTLYRVLIPDEIEACRKSRAECAAQEPKPEVVERDVDYYNVRENRIKVYERDGYKCRYCGKQLTRFTCTLDHVTPVAAGGTNSLDNLVTACLGCNSRKHQRPVGDFLADQ